MGVYDRDYMDDPETWKHRYTAVWTLIGINALVWVLWQFGISNPSLGAVMSGHFMVSPHAVLEKYYLHTLLTSAFSHIALPHILFNMLFLYILGGDLEVFYGRRNLFFMYAFCAVFSGLAHVLAEMAVNGWQPGMGTPALGASGAIMGLAVAAAFVDPHKPILIFGLFPLQLKWLVTIYVVSDLLGVIQGSGGNIARAAHLGGAAAGFVFFKLDLRWFESRGRKGSGLLHRLKLWFRRRNMRVLEKIPDSMPRETAAAHSSSRASRSSGVASYSSDIDAQTSRRVDDLLGKISREGMQSLSAEEQAFLAAASEKYRHKRK